MENIKRFDTNKWNITINNPAEHNISRDDIINILLNDMTLDYCCFAYERGLNTHTEHVHIFILSKNKIRNTTVLNRFPTAHLEKASGTPSQNRDYIAKIGKWETTAKSLTRVEDSFWEHGTLPPEQDKKQSALAEVVELMDDGADVNQVIEQFPQYALRANELLTLHELRNSKSAHTSFRDVDVTYIYGPTASGKTHYLYATNDPREICRITNYHNTRGIFDSYNGQDVLAFDEYHAQIPLPSMLTYLDIYPVSLPARYRNRVARYTKVYIISNIPLDEQYATAREHDLATWRAFHRRINTVIFQEAPNVQHIIDKEVFLPCD